MHMRTAETAGFGFGHVEQLLAEAGATLAVIDPEQIDIEVIHPQFADQPTHHGTIIIADGQRQRMAIARNRQEAVIIARQAGGNRLLHLVKTLRIDRYRDHHVSSGRY